MIQRSLHKAGWLLAGALAMAAFVSVAKPSEAADLPGEGKTVNMARASWDTGWFQAAIYAKAFEALGYKMGEMKTLDNPFFYQAVGQGDVDLWVNGWFPIHNTYKKDFEDGAEIIGYVAKGGALQGYLVDKKTVEALHIKSVEDFKRPEVIKQFDTNGDGKAELVACPPGWGCEKVIAHHLDVYKLRDYVEPIKAAYTASMADAVARYKNGGSIFFYTWTPNWTVGELAPGKDVMWIEVPFPSLPEDQKQYEDQTTIPGVIGCVEDPCKMGFPANDIRPVANKEFLKENPAVRRLLEVASIPLGDIFTQNAEMNAGADSPADLERQANEWIASHQSTFDGWIAEAKAAAQ